MRPPRVALCLAITQLLVPPARADHAGTGATWSGTLPIMGMATFVILISILFEKAQHLLLLRVSTRTVPVVHALFREWALLGFVGLLFFVSTQSGLLELLSKWQFGADEPTKLTGVVQHVDVVLFTSLMLFLALMAGLVRTGGRWERACHFSETCACHTQALISNFQRWRIKQAAQRTTDATRHCLAPGPCYRRCVRRAPCRRVRAWESRAATELLALEEQLVYAAMRARFVLREQTPPGEHRDVPPEPVQRGVSSSSRRSRRRRGSAELILESHTAANEPVVLSSPQDPLYKSKAKVHAFRLSTDFALPTLQQTGREGDWVVTEGGGGVRIVPAGDFDKTYEPVALEPGRYRRQRVYLARLMLHPYIVENHDCPPVQGAAGTYLVQDFGDSDTGHVMQRVVSVTDFQKEFHPVDDSISEMVPPAKAQLLSSLPVDFNFALYLSDVYSQAVVRLVGLSWPAWACVQCTLLLVWLFEPLAINPALPIAVAGYAAMVAAIMLRDHLQRVQRLLSCRDALRGDLFAMSRTQNQPTRLPVSVMVRQAKTPVNRRSDDNNAEGVTGFQLSDVPKVSATLPSHHDRVLADLADENLSCAESIERTSVAVAEGAGRFRPKLTRLNTNLTTASRASRGGASEIEVGFSALTSPGTVPQPSFVFEAKRQAPTWDGSRSDSNDGVRARYNASACSNDGFRVDDDDSDAGIGVGADHSTMPPQLNNGLRAAPSPILTATTVSKFDWDAYQTSVRGTVEMQRVGTGVYSVNASPKARAVAEKIAIHAAQKQSSSARSKLLQRVFRVAVRKAVVLSTIAKVCALLDKAPVDDIPLSTRGSCAVLCWKRKGLCRPRNKQEQLLCFGSQGVGFTRLFIQVLVLTTALYMASSVGLLLSRQGSCFWPSDHFTAGECTSWLALMALPATVVIALLPSIVTTFVMTTNVEDMSKSDIARQTVHTQYLTHALQALRMLSVFLLNAESLFGEGRKPMEPGALPEGFLSLRLGNINMGTSGRSAVTTASSVNAPLAARVAISHLAASLGSPKFDIENAQLPWAQRVYGGKNTSTYAARRQRVRAVFNMLDRNFQGYITIGAMRNLLRDLGVKAMSERCLVQMLEVLDANGDGVIAFAEFFEFVAMQDRKCTGSSEQDASFVTRFMFALVDRDQRGFITVAALLRALSSVGALVQVDELARLMTRYGHSGRLYPRDFTKLLNEHNRFNRWLI